MNNSASGVGLISILKEKTPLIGLEIGCYAGINAENLLECLPQLYLYGVDPYTPYIDWNGEATLFSNDNSENAAMQRFSRFLNRFKLHKKTSDEAVNDFEDEIFDFIFIDGLHTYDQVLKDCLNYYPKLKKNGLFSGHDYNTIVDVKKAVDEFSLKTNKTISQTKNDVWYWIK